MPDAKVVKFKMMPCVKNNGRILDLSLDMCPTLHHPLVMDGYSQSSATYLLFFVGRIYLQHFKGPYSFANIMDCNHTIKLVSTGISTCHSTLTLTTQVNTRK